MLKVADKVADTLYEISADEKVRAEYEMRQKAMRDRAWMIDEAREKAREDGKREGEREIIDMLKSGKSPEEIIKEYDTE